VGWITRCGAHHSSIMDSRARPISGAKRISEAGMPASPEVELDHSPDRRAIQIIPTGAALGAEIRGVDLRHLGDAVFSRIDGTYNSGGYVRQGVTPTDDPRVSPGAVHPLVCVHPETGRRMLYLGRRRNAYIAGLELGESEGLLDELWSYVSRPEFSWQHVWRVGDLVLWDNRCTMHRRDPFDPASRRIMHRTQVKGD